MGWFSATAEFINAATAAYVRTSAKLKQDNEPTDFCPDETKQFISESLESCRPVSQHLTRRGRILTKFNLGRNDYFGSLLAIDANTKSTKRTICIIALKTAVKSICAGYNVDGIRAVTYSYLANR